ncbi:unnamed protein product [Anisakis simplex]|uniref:Synaptotagmin-17 (inferred by orthology to a human protein) n=1 Tax=Anisakis simplex TaxID=6269 RepID=A0A0M3J061_ANISI|nr:unnamed protein product [Anisakis simplex]
MDRLASCHAMHGFLNVYAYRRKGHIHSNCNNNNMKSHIRSRSLSSSNHRGMITPPRHPAKGIISPIASHRRHSVKKLNEMKLILQVMDYDRFSHDDPIDEILLLMKHVKLDKSPVHCTHLQKPTVSKECVGELMLSLCYLPDSDRITVNVVKARLVPSKDYFGNSDLHVKLWLVKEGDRLEKRRTTVKSHTLTPVFNESFVFSVPSKETILNEVNLVATVMDLTNGNDEVGHIVIGALGNETGKRQWNDVLSQPETTVTMWHKLSSTW